MEFAKIKTVDGVEYVSYYALAAEKDRLDVEKLKNLVMTCAGIFAYYSVGAEMKGCYPGTFIISGPGTREKQTIHTINWGQYFFKISELETFGIIPNAKELRKAGQNKAALESMKNTIAAAFRVGSWIGKLGIQPGEITKVRVQEYLWQNKFGYGDTALFKDVLESIPSSEKNIGGRPPKK